jgi:hypothetical protein
MGSEMAEVDPLDDAIDRYVISRHKYDPESNHFRWFYEIAYDTKREFERKFDELGEELEVRQLSGEAHFKEQISGIRLEVGYFQNSQARRWARQEEGAYRVLNWRTRIVFFFQNRNSRWRKRFRRR